MKKTITVVVVVVALLGLCLAGVVAVHAWTRPPQAGPISSDDRSIAYIGDWSRDDTGGEPVRSASDPAQAIFTFQGVGIQWIGSRASDSGISEVFIDGEKVATVDGYRSGDSTTGPMFTSALLDDGVHTIRVATTGDADPDSTGTRVGIKRFVVFKTTPPPVIASVSADAADGGVAIAWPASDAAQVDGYRVYRSDGPAKDFDVIAELGTDSTDYLDDLSSAGTATPRYYVVAVDIAGRESPMSEIASVVLPRPGVPSYRQRDDCPSPTVEVTDASELRDALADAGPGTVIGLADGVYSGTFEIEAEGTKDDPIWICGSSDAILRGPSVNTGYGLHIADSHDVIATGFTVTNSLKGVMVDRSSRITLSQLTVKHIGNEAVHLRSKTTDSILAGSFISDTGRQTTTEHPEWGEGVYVGSHASNWCSRGYAGCKPNCSTSTKGCEPDASDRNVIADNMIFDTTAEAVDIKEGALNGIVVGNEIDASSSTATERWILVRSNGWYITDNHGVSDRGGNGIQIYRPPTPGYGTGNVVSGNSADFGSSPSDETGYSVMIQTKGNVVTCDNSYRGAADIAASNVNCVPNGGKRR